jgi:hypothetical protein
MAATTPFDLAKAYVTETALDMTVDVYSPENRTYTTSDVPLNFSWTQYLNPGGYHVGYKIDYEYHFNAGHTNVSGSYVTTLHNLSDGYHQLTIYVSGTFPGLTFGVDFTVDTPRPAVTILSPINTTYQTNPQLQFVVDEPVSWMGYCLDEQDNVTVTENAVNLTGLSDGIHTVMVYANDTEGNIGASKTVYFTVDSTSPTVSLLVHENEFYYLSEVPLNFVVNEEVSEILCCLDGQENVSISGNTTLTGLANGLHCITVYAVDNAGNVGVSETVHFSVDTYLPVLFAIVVYVVVVVGVGLLFYKKRKP